MFIGDGAKLVRDAFALAKEKSKPGLKLDRHILTRCCDAHFGKTLQGPGTMAPSFSLTNWTRSVQKDSILRFPGIAR